MNDITNILDNLSEDEKKFALEILHELSTSGASEKYNKLLYDDYEEIPVDVETFLHDPRYLGKGLTNEEGKFTLYPYWEDVMKKIYPDPLLPAKYNTLALTGGIGLGKSTIAVIIGIYELYRMLCLKDPYLHYGLMPTDLITFAVMNITMDAAKGVAWDKIQSLIQSSSWFMSHGSVTKSGTPEWKPPKGIELIYGSLSRHIIGRAVYWAFFDEVSFQPNIDVAKQIEKAKTLVNTASARMQSRFMKNDKNPTILILASSKRTEQSYMETFIEGKKRNESKTTLVVDEPQWVIRPDKDSKEKFKVALGNKYLSSEVLPLNITSEQEQLYRNRGYQILEVPIGYYETFIDDIDVALTDIAGISTTNSSRYISGERWSATVIPELKNPFNKEIIEVGDAPEDSAQYSDFFDLKNVDRKYIDRPIFIHMDMSISGDKTGIAGVWLIGKLPPQPDRPESKDLVFQLAFSVAIKAPRGHQVSFEKNRIFIRWLKEQGFAIKGISTDTFQSYDTGQALKSEGFKYDIVSVDRCKDNVCQTYQYFKNTIYEKRLRTYATAHLAEEIIGLERDNNSGKVDHSPSGINSKDTADAVCGAIWNASQHGDEFQFNFGEDIQNLINANDDGSFNTEQAKKQITLDFEQELMKIQNPLNMEESNSQFVDFGMGKAEPLNKFNVNSYAYLSQGIIPW